MKREGDSGQCAGDTRNHKVDGVGPTLVVLISAVFIHLKVNAINMIP